MGDKTTAPGQPLAAHQHHGSTRLLRQAHGQGHGVGIAAKKRRPKALPVRRDLVGQQAHGLTPPQGLDHLAHTRQCGGHGQHAGPVACGLHHLGQPGLARGAVQHRDGAALRAPAPGRCLGRQFEAPLVRREVQNAAPGRIRLLHTGLAFDAAGQWRPQPQARQLGHHAAGMGHSGTHVAQRIPCQGRIGQKATPVRGRRTKRNPAHGRAHDVQQPQWKYGKESKDDWH